MVRLIDADAVIEDAFNLMDRNELLDDVPQIIKDYCDAQPTVNVAPERSGVWSEEYDPNDDLFFRRKFRCSACNGWNTYGFTRYCPQCGAKMLNASALTMEKVMEQWSD